MPVRTESMVVAVPVEETMPSSQGPCSGERRGPVRVPFGEGMCSMAHSYESSERDCEDHELSCYMGWEILVMSCVSREDTF